MSELRTNKIYPRDGLPAGASAGGVIQIVESSLTTGNVSGTLFQTTSSTYVDVFSGTITPTSSSNKILVSLALNPYAGNTNTLWMNGQILRGSTQVWYSRNLFFRSGSAFKSVQSAIQFLDSPATTSAVTYKLQVKIESNVSSTGEFYADNSNYNNRMILMEVSG
tara:strand:- start:813 stop:1307 length:495 start_codon:yes stop_codon:yes gene_type:complete